MPNVVLPVPFLRVRVHACSRHRTSFFYTPEIVDGESDGNGTDPRGRFVMRSSKLFTITLALAFVCSTIYAQLAVKPDTKPAEQINQRHKALQRQPRTQPTPRIKSRALSKDISSRKKISSTSLLPSHPMFQYEKQGCMVGKYHISDREEEFTEEGGGKAFNKENNQERFDDLPFRCRVDSGSSQQLCRS